MQEIPSNLLNSPFVEQVLCETCREAGTYHSTRQALSWSSQPLSRSWNRWPQDQGTNDCNNPRIPVSTTWCPPPSELTPSNIAQAVGLFVTRAAYDGTADKRENGQRSTIR